MPIRKSITLLAIFFTSFDALGQETTISGTVVDKTTQSAVEFANVQLLNLPDSSISKTTVTDRRGKFSIQSVTPGNFILRCTFIGYQKTNLPVSIKSSVSKFNLGTIEIVVFSGTLAEVTVTSRKSLLNTSIDRKVYNVNQDIIAQTGSASDVLKNIPSVEVDIEGQVSLRGSADVMILINGRPSPLMGKSRAEVLQQLPANSIERIEVITNPSARFRPDGTSGIINIVLKKNTKPGWNGTVTSNAGTGQRYNGSINFNFNPGKVNLFGSYGIRKDNRIRTNHIDRIYLDSNLNNQEYYTEDNQSHFNPLSHIVSIGVDYKVNDHNSFGLSGNYVNRNLVRNNVGNIFYYDKDYLLTLHYDRLMYDPEFEIEKDASVYWQHNFPQEDHELRLEFNSSSSEEQDDNHFTNLYHFPSMMPSYDNSLLSERDHQQQLTIDYTNPLSEDKKLEAGYSGSFTQLDLDFYGEYFDPVQAKFVKDIIKSNRFLYNDAIHALYGTFQQSFEKFGYSAGLRAEQVFIKGNLVTKDSLIDNVYFNIYPTLHLSYKIKKSEIQLNYSRRVNRPDGDELNPFPEYRDPRNLYAGNPKLLPEIIHSVEFGYKWENEKFSFVPSLYYRYKLNGFTTVTVPLNDTTLLTTEQNLSNDKSTGLELIFSAKAGNFFRANLSSNFFYNQIDATDLGYSNKKSIVSMSSNFNSTFIITKTTMFQISSNYRSARLTPQGKVFGSFVLNAGARQDLFKKKLSVILTASDIFKTMQQKSELNTPFLKQTSIGRRDARIIYLGLTYNFGKTVKKSGEEKLQFDNNLD